MADIKTVWVGHVGQWAIGTPGLEMDDGLETAVILSLFTDARASDEDAAAAGVDERRGWWGDSYADEPGDRIGSKLWLLAREKRLPATVQRAQRYAEQALQWLLDDGVVGGVAVTAELVGTDVLGLGVVIQRLAGPVAQYRFEAFWKGA